LETKIGNLDSYKISVPWDALPPTFQDAVTVSRRMSFRYLWIDSLCIIQDSEEDWETESAHMAQIYRDSILTIAATSSASSDEHFLKPRSAINEPKLVKLEHKDDSEEKDEAENKQEPKYFLASRPLAVHSKIGPLSARAWVFQEEKLSTRIMHFSETETSYECRKGLACECDMHGYEAQSDPFKSTSFDARAVDLDVLDAPDDAGGDPLSLPNPGGAVFRSFMAWQEHVGEYSKRKLTRPSDKLPALSGMARVYRSLTRSAYMAGMWRDNLVLDMCWLPTSRPPREKTPWLPPAEPAEWKPNLVVPVERLPPLSEMKMVYDKKYQRGHDEHMFAIMDSVLEDFGEGHLTGSEKEEREPSPHSFVAEYRAPTFSWASVDRVVAYRWTRKTLEGQSAPLQLVFETMLVAARCKVDGLNPFGRVSDGFAILQGRCVEGKIATRPGRNWGIYTIRVGEEVVEFASDVPLAIDSGSGDDEAIVRRARADDNLHVRFRGTVWCLCLVSSSDGTAREVLVLGHSRSIQGSFERLGLIDSSTSGTVEKLNQWFQPGKAKMTVIKVV
jgi:hypothetical protein